MSGSVGVTILAALKDEAKTLEREAARGHFNRLEDFVAAQNQLFGVERALEICKKVVSEADDE